jgi:hypothetical protein
LGSLPSFFSSLPTVTSLPLIDILGYDLNPQPDIVTPSIEFINSEAEFAKEVAISKAAHLNRKTSAVLQYRRLLYQYTDQCIVRHTRELERVDEIKYYHQHLEQRNKKAQDERQQYLKDRQNTDKTRFLDATIMAPDIKPAFKNRLSDEEADGEYEDMESYARRNTERRQHNPLN